MKRQSDREYSNQFDAYLQNNDLVPLIESLYRFQRIGVAPLWKEELITITRDFFSEHPQRGKLYSIRKVLGCYCSTYIGSQGFLRYPLFEKEFRRIFRYPKTKIPSLNSVGIQSISRTFLKFPQSEFVVGFRERCPSGILSLLEGAGLPHRGNLIVCIDFQTNHCAILAKNRVKRPTSK